MGELARWREKECVQGARKRSCSRGAGSEQVGERARGRLGKREGGREGGRAEFVLHSCCISSE